jgi:hypothetical protein
VKANFELEECSYQVQLMARLDPNNLKNHRKCVNFKSFTVKGKRVANRHIKIEQFKNLRISGKSSKLKFRVFGAFGIITFL